MMPQECPIVQPRARADSPTRREGHGGPRMDLTPSQRKAIAHDGRNLQLIACAGSGKTEVVARRVAYLLSPGKGGGLAPRNIIAFTFTEKAAAELKERIVTRTRQALGEIPGMAEMFVGTIHAFCLELLKSESPKYLKYEVLNEVQQTLFVDRHSKASGLTLSTTLTGQALRRYVDTATYGSALSKRLCLHVPYAKFCNIVRELARKNNVSIGAAASAWVARWAQQADQLVRNSTRAPKKEIRILSDGRKVFYG